ncbi:IS66 family insertion sequence element accessory protein TnpB [Desulfosporosinus sp. SB140]|uniref:IS66 family insertion sequence element accessory protein TnpB n=1 Tax=Desulfosporosinus paludis TaxID=3115649 RepID=UPI00388F23F3
MIQHMADHVEHIYLALGYTDFRRQITGLTAMVALKFKLDPYSGTTLFLFCNKRHTVIKALRWDGNGFLLATKQLANDMKFQWPKTQGELRDINIRQMQWLLEGLQIDQKKAHPQTVDTTSTVF